MQTTTDPTTLVVKYVKSQFESINGRLLKQLSFVPDDKLNWSPSSTANSALRIVAHSALTSRVFAKLITDTMPDPMPSPEGFLTALYDDTVNYPTRESVIDLVNATFAELSQALDTITQNNIDAMHNSPFGPIPVRFWTNLTFLHMAGHVGQLEYLQTIWGDRENHM